MTHGAENLVENASRLFGVGITGIELTPTE